MNKKKFLNKAESKFLYGLGICEKCGTVNVCFTIKGNLVNHGKCKHRKALRPIGFL
jgi:hypothetical protein